MISASPQAVKMRMQGVTKNGPVITQAIYRSVCGVGGQRDFIVAPPTKRPIIAVNFGREIVGVLQG